MPSSFNVFLCVLYTLRNIFMNVSQCSQSTSQSDVLVNVQKVAHSHDLANVHKLSSNQPKVINILVIAYKLYCAHILIIICCKVNCNDVSWIRMWRLPIGHK